jgi:hypothetical protein
MRKFSLIASGLLLSVSMGSLQAEQQEPPKAAAADASPALTERQKKMNDDAAQIAELARQLHTSLEKEQSGEISAAAAKQAAQLEKLVKSTKDQAAKK